MSGLHLTGCERAGGGYRAGDPRLLNRADAQERIAELLEAEARYIAEIGRLKAENVSLRENRDTFASARLDIMEDHVGLFRDGVEGAATAPGNLTTVRAKLKLLLRAFDAMELLPERATP